MTPSVSTCSLLPLSFPLTVYMYSIFYSHFRYPYAPSDDKTAAYIRHTHLRSSLTTVTSITAAYNVETDAQCDHEFDVEYKSCCVMLM